MYIVDRSIAVIKPREPFVKWLNSIPDSEYPEFTLNMIRADCTVLMLPEFNEPEQAVSYLDEFCVSLFKTELGTWIDDQSLWPKDLSLQAFWEWFDVEIHSTVIDTIDEALNNSEISLINDNE